MKERKGAFHLVCFYFTQERYNMSYSYCMLLTVNKHVGCIMFHMHSHTLFVSFCITIKVDVTTFNTDISLWVKCWSVLVRERGMNQVCLPSHHIQLIQWVVMCAVFMLSVRDNSQLQRSVLSLILTSLTSIHVCKVGTLCPYSKAFHNSYSVKMLEKLCEAQSAVWLFSNGNLLSQCQLFSGERTHLTELVLVLRARY